MMVSEIRRIWNMKDPKNLEYARDPENLEYVLTISVAPTISVAGHYLSAIRPTISESQCLCQLSQWL